MSLINQMLRDLNARHATDSESALPEDVRPLPTQQQGARFGLGRGLLIGALALLGAGGVAWLMLAPGAADVVPESVPASANSAAPTPESHPAAVAPAPPPAPAPAPPPAAALTDALVPALPTLTNARPLAPPGTEGAPAAVDKATTRGKHASKTAGPVQLKLDDLLTFNTNPAKAPTATDKPSEAAPAPKLSIDRKAAPAMREGGGEASRPKSEKVERVEKTPQIEKVERGDRGDEGLRNGIQAYKQGRMNEAVIQLQSALRENARHATARQALLGILVEQRRWDEALALLKEGLDLMPEQIGWVMAMARIQVERGNPADAWSILQRHAGYAEQNADYQGFAGVLLQHLKKPHEAAEHYKAALKLRPKEGRWWYALATALEADNQSAEAIEAYKRAQTLGGLTPAMAETVEKKLH